MTEATVTQRLEAIRASIRAENLSYGELAELQDLAAHIDAGDVELLQWSGSAGMTNAYRFTVEFDSEVWADLTPTERRRWIADVENAINDIAYCSESVARA